MLRISMCTLSTTAKTHSCYEQTAHARGCAVLKKN